VSKVLINKDFDAVILKTILKRYWIWPVLFVGLFFFLAYTYLRYTKPVYESSLVLQLDNQDNAKEILQIENINSKIDNDIPAQIELMRSQLLFEQAVKKINYHVSLYSKGSVLTEEKYKSSTFYVQPFELKDSSLINVPIDVRFENGKVRLSYLLNGRNHSFFTPLNIRLSTPHFDLLINAESPAEFEKESEENTLYFIFNSVQSYAARYLPALQVYPLDPQAKTIQVLVQTNNAELSKDLALAVAEAFIEYDDQNQRKGSDKIISFIDKQLDSLSNELKQSKDSLMWFQRKSNLPDPERLGAGLTEKIKTVQENLFAVDDEISALNSIYSKVKADPNRLEVYRMIPDMYGRSFEGSLSGQLTDLQELLERKESLLFKVTEENSEVKGLNQRIQSRITNIRKTIAIVLDRLKDKSRSLTAQLVSTEGEYFQLPEKKMEFGRLKNIQDLNEKYFTLLTEKKVLYAISDAGYASNNRILTRPVTNNTPVSPNRQLIFSSFSFFGLLIGLALLVYLYLTFNEINLLEDLKKLLPSKATILGGIPVVKSQKEFSQLIVQEMPKGHLAESLRKIRTNLNYINPNYQTIAVTSSVSGEGKTFIALNLGGIIAMSGKRTIILDLDLRKPKIHMAFNTDNVKGMSNLIVGAFQLEECIQRSPIDQLDFITAGPIPPNPSELILSDRFREIVQELKSRYDVIIIDNPPIGLVSDGVKNLTEADIPIYVFKSHFSKRNFVYRVKELFEMKQIDKLNVILNAVKPSKSDKYGYGYGYYENTDTGISLSDRIKNIFTRKKH
jgi:capsular exopolysaccharide synthesis family protein